MDWLLAGLALVMLLLAGDALVKGAVNLSLRLGIPALIVSLTIVAFGTSAPELLISIKAVMGGSPGIALGNVVGSNIANVLLVLGLPAVVAGLTTSHCKSQTSFAQMLAVSVGFAVLCLTGPLTALKGVLLLAVLVAILLWQARDARQHRKDNGAETLDEADPSLPGWRIALLLVLGLIGLPLGADLLVDSAVNIARSFGVSETVIGLTLIAVGTSLPELATTLVAALRRAADVAIGNVIGSNLFNLLGIIGVASLVGTIPVDPGILRSDLWVMIGCSVLLVPFVFWGRDMGRIVGLAFCALYAIYLVSLFV